MNLLVRVKTNTQEIEGELVEVTDICLIVKEEENKIIGINKKDIQDLEIVLKSNFKNGGEELAKCLECKYSSILNGTICNNIDHQKVCLENNFMFFEKRGVIKYLKIR